MKHIVLSLALVAGLSACVAPGESVRDKQQGTAGLMMGAALAAMAARAL